MSLLRFEATLALRHLVRGGAQTWLTIGAVSTGVTLIVFISSFTFGLRDYAESLISDLMPDITVQSAKPKILPTSFRSRTVIGETEPITQRNLDIIDWQGAETRIRSVPGVLQVAPAVLQEGFAARGNKSFALSVYGADPAKLDGVTAVRKYIVQGRYLGLAVDECVVDYKLVSELGVRLGDHIRLLSDSGSGSFFHVVGLYDSTAQRGYYKAFITLRAAQALYGTGNSVRSILIRTASIWDAEATADRINAILPYDAAPWTRDFPSAASQFHIYDAVTYLVSGFSLIASSFAIASVLIVQVLQKSRQIGILKSIGSRNGQIFRVFVLEGFLVSIVGACLGAALGWALVAAISTVQLPPTSSGAATYQLFPTSISAPIVAAAMFSAILSTVIAAVLPARRAAKLDPVQVMR